MKIKNSKKIVLVICIIIFIISMIQVTKMFIEYKQNNNTYTELISEIIIPNVQYVETVNNVKEEFTIDWEKLKKINTDIVAWIVIPDTKINYPILNSNNSLFYINHDVNKKSSKYGSIFIANNSNLFKDKEVEVYGHNMKDGSMFAMLKKYMNKEFYESHKNINIYTPDGNYTGYVFSVYSNDARDETNTINTLDFKERIKYYQEKNVHYQEKTDGIEHILKLITCSYENANSDQRYFIIINLKKVDFFLKYAL